MALSRTLPAGRRAVLFGAASFALFPGRSARAEQGPPILKISEPDGRERLFDEAAIAAFTWYEIVTATRWTEGIQRFRGPRLKDVLTSGDLSRKDLEGRSLLMTALNDFGIAVPASDAWDYDLILARERNGQAMRVRDKGPLWLVYPRDQRPELQNAVMDERWIWQLSEIKVL